jgi:hypothetical protein
MLHPDKLGVVPEAMYTSINSATVCLQINSPIIKLSQEIQTGLANNNIFAPILYLRR